MGKLSLWFPKNINYEKKKSVFFVTPLTRISYLV